MISWRIQETARERRPFPKASKHPARTVPSVETRKPRLVMRSMGTPTAMRARSASNRPMICVGRSQANKVPAAMMTAVRIKLHRIMWRMRSWRPAP